MFRNAAVLMGLLVVVYWAWASFHELTISSAGPMEFARSKGLLYAAFVAPAILSSVAIIWIKHPLLRVLAIIANVIIGTWWLSLSLAMPLLSSFQIFWALFALSSAVAVIAIVLNSRRGSSPGQPGAEL